MSDGRFSGPDHLFLCAGNNDGPHSSIFVDPDNEDDMKVTRDHHGSAFTKYYTTTN